MDREIHLKWLASAATDIGIQIEDSAQEFLAGHHLSREDNLLYEDYLKLLNDWENQLTDSDLGLHLSEAMNHRDMGTYGVLLESAATIEEFFGLIIEYESLLGGFNIPKFIPGLTASRFEYEVNNLSRYPVTQDITMTLGFYIKSLRSFIGDSWQPISVGFEFPQPKNTSEYKRLFGANLYFSQVTNFIEIESKFLSHEVSSEKKELLTLIKKHADSVLTHRSEENTISEKVKSILLSEISNGKIDQHRVAEQLNTSRSSLQRKLQAEGTSFRQLRDEVIYQLSRKILTQTNVSCSEIALTLGYSETSAFNHAFTRLSKGLTPLQLRKQFQKNKAM